MLLCLLLIHAGGDWGLRRLGTVDPVTPPNDGPVNGRGIEDLSPSLPGSDPVAQPSAPSSPSSTASVAEKPPRPKPCPKPQPFQDGPHPGTYPLWEFKGPTLATLMDPSSSKASSWGCRDIKPVSQLDFSSAHSCFHQALPQGSVLVLDQQPQSWLPVQPTSNSVKVMGC